MNRKVSWTPTHLWHGFSESICLGYSHTMSFKAWGTLLWTGVSKLWKEVVGSSAWFKMWSLWWDFFPWTIRRWSFDSSWNCDVRPSFWASFLCSFRLLSNWRSTLPRRHALKLVPKWLELFLRVIWLNLLQKAPFVPDFPNSWSRLPRQPQQSVIILRGSSPVSF